MVKKEVRYFWSAVIALKTLEAPGLAFAVQTDGETRKGRKVSVFRMGWMKEGKVIFDPGARLRGWLKMQSKTVRPSLGDIVNYGVRILTIPTPGYQTIAELEELTGMDNPPSDLQEGYVLPDELNGNIAYPIKEAFSVGEGASKRAIFAFHYELHRAITFNVKLFSFARGFTPEGAKWMFENLGCVTGLGDRYSRGFGLFELVDFKVLDTEEIPL